jgi:hypothetical protein
MYVQKGQWSKKSADAAANVGFEGRRRDTHGGSADSFGHYCYATAWPPWSIAHLWIMPVFLRHASLLGSSSHWRSLPMNCLQMFSFRAGARGRELWHELACCDVVPDQQFHARASIRISRHNNNLHHTRSQRPRMPPLPLPPRPRSTPTPFPRKTPALIMQD